MYPTPARLRLTLADVIAPDDLGLLVLLILIGLGTLWLLMRLRSLQRLRARIESEQAKLQASERRFRSLVQHSFDVVAVVGAEGTLQSVSASATDVIGCVPEELQGTDLRDWVHPDDADRLLAFVRSPRPPTEVGPLVECRVRRQSGIWQQAEIAVSNLLDDPDVRGIVLNIRDITDRKGLEEQLTHRAFHDTLTGLPNRDLFKDRLDHAVARVRRSREPVSMLLIDLDGFKAVNDALGHLLGDALLRGVAERLLASVRPGDTVARLGGDEFAVLLDSADEKAASLVADRLTASLRQPLTYGGIEMFTSASIGIATAHDPNGESDPLMRNADAAMYAAKQGGKNHHEAFNPSMHGRVLRLAGLRAELRTAVERDEFVLVYQPIIELASGRLAAVEALVRWRHPGRGLLPPMDFIPLAEETGLIVPLGSWVLQRAAAQMSTWQLKYPDATLQMAVNVSPRQLREDFAAEVASVCARNRVEADNLIVEVTENVFVGDDADEMMVELATLRGLGVHIAIDDFGTGYSSLAYLRKLPRDIVKMDRSFVTDVPARSNEASFMRSVVQLLSTLNVEIVAEGIETEEQLEYVRSIGCHMAQGYHLFRPMDAKAMDRLLLARTTPAVPVPTA